MAHACSDADVSPHVCSNGRLVAREKLERVVLHAILEEVFSPETLAYLFRSLMRARNWRILNRLSGKRSSRLLRARCLPRRRSASRASKLSFRHRPVPGFSSSHTLNLDALVWEASVPGITRFSLRA